MLVSLILGGWLLVGLVVGLRRSAPAWEKILAVIFWPFFVAAGAGSSEGLRVSPPVTRSHGDAGPLPSGLPPSSPDDGPLNPVARLRSALPAALPADHPAHAAVARLAAAVTQQQERLSRLAQVIRQAAPAPGDDAALAEARKRSVASLLAAQAAQQQALSQTLATTDEAATRLWLMVDQGQPTQVEALLDGLLAGLVAGLVATLDAESEVNAAAPEPTGA